MLAYKKLKKCSKFKDIGDGYKLLYIGMENNRNAAGIVLNKGKKHKIADV